MQILRASTGVSRMLFDLPRFDAAVDNLLEAALVPSRWNAVLEEIADASKARGLCILPVVGRHPGVPATESMVGPLAAYFDEGWHRNDFRERAIPHLIRNGTALEQDFASAHDLKDNLYYKFLDKHGLGWSAIVGFRNGDDFLCLVLQRSRKTGPFSREEEKRVATMQGRLSLAASIMRSISASRMEGIAEAFELAKLACVFLDRFGKVTKVNDQARRLLGGDLQITQGKLRARRSGDTAALRLGVAAAVGSLPFADSATLSPVMVSRTGKRPLIVRMQHLRGTMRDVFRHSVAIAVIEDLEEGPLTDSGTLKHLFGLTPAESALALELAAGHAVKETAEKAEISYETARTYLKMIYRKTGTERQSELAALLANLRV